MLAAQLRQYCAAIYYKKAYLHTKTTNAAKLQQYCCLGLLQALYFGKGNSHMNHSQTLKAACLTFNSISYYVSPSLKGGDILYL